MLRVTAVLAACASLALVLAYLHLVGSGPFASRESRHLRAMKERTARPTSVTPYRFADIVALPHGTALASYAPLERRAVRIEGHVAGMMRSTDGDLHLEITAIPRVAGDRDTEYVTAEVTSAFQKSNGWNWESLRQAFVPASGGPSFDRATPRVRISGWLLYDWQYDGLPARDPLRETWNHIRPGPRGFKRRDKPTPIWPRVSGWEIHPVTAIEVWDEATGRYRRLAS